MSGGRDDPAGRGGPLSALRCFTPARVGIGRVGASLPTREVLAFGLAHARARDAVHAALDVDALARDLSVPLDGDPEVAGALAPAVVRSAAPDRATYLARPDLGRCLAPGQREVLALGAPAAEIAVVIADGLSAVAVQRHAAPVVVALRRRAPARWSRAPLVVALQGRVALGDEVGAALGARLVLVLIGERPGLGSPDSLGAYLTFDPRPGRTDAQRNCVSNIRPVGLTYDEAAQRIDDLAAAALDRGLTGVGLEVDTPALGAPSAPVLGGP